MTSNEKATQSLRMEKYAKLKWKTLQPETKFFLFSVFILILSQAWLSYRHSQKALEAMGSDLVGRSIESAADSSVSRSLSAFRQLSEQYTLQRHSNKNRPRNLERGPGEGLANAAELLEEKILEYFADLPKWVKEYAKWHRQKMSQITPQNWDKQRYFIVRCLRSDNKGCGEASHRLVSIAASLLLAKQSNRIFLIKWTQPADLENYLVPPLDHEQEYSIDWRIPKWLLRELGDLNTYPKLTGSNVNALRRARNYTAVAVTMRHLTRDHGSRYYNQNQDNEDPQFRLGFGKIWRLLFRPAPAVQSLLEQHMNALGVQPGSYVMAQVRTPEVAKPKELSELAKASLECTKSITRDNENSYRFLVASESQAVLSGAMDLHGWSDRVLALKTSSNILSLDKETERWRSRRMEDYYPTFVYLYMYANAKCVAFYDDDNGRWGSLISLNPLCVAKMKSNPDNQCETLDLTTVVPKLAKRETKASTSQALSSINEAVHQVQVQAQRHVQAQAQRQVPVQSQRIVVDRQRFRPQKMYWAPVPEFPDWMNDYFDWHMRVRANLNEENWRSQRYLVMRCLASDEKCGGASDRLQSFLLAIKFASLGGRLLFIKWERPAMLEEFLVPPKGGLDWRMPEWLDKHMDYEGSRMLIAHAFKPIVRKLLLVTMRHQL